MLFKMSVANFIHRIPSEWHLTQIVQWMVLQTCIKEIKTSSICTPLSSSGLLVSLSGISVIVGALLAAGLFAFITGFFIL